MHTATCNLQLQLEATFTTDKSQPPSEITSRRVAPLNTPFNVLSTQLNHNTHLRYTQAAAAYQPQLPVLALPAAHRAPVIPWATHPLLLLLPLLLLWVRPLVGCLVALHVLLLVGCVVGVTGWQRV
jgi:hypothetical protein